MNTDTKIMHALLAIIIVILAMGVFKGNKQQITIQDDSSNDRTISISGKSERMVAPDTAKISFTMTRKDKNLSKATDSVNARIGDMLGKLKDFGIEKKDIKTTSYSVNPEYDYRRDYNDRVFDGYRVRQTVDLIIRDLDQVSGIMTEIANFKVDNVSGLTFYVDQDEKIREELRQEAIVDAKAKAKKLSNELGINLDTIVGFNEGGGYSPKPMYARSYGNEMMLDAAVEEAYIPTGENSYSASVNIVYLIK